MYAKWKDSRVKILGIYIKYCKRIISVLKYKYIYTGRLDYGRNFARSRVGMHCGFGM